MSAVLGENCHGKGGVRLLKLHRSGDRHDFIQLTAQVLLTGGCDDAFKKADNRNIVATDTCKNTIYILARRHQFASIEEFGIIVAKHFLAQYPNIVHKADIQLVKDLWTRVVNKDSHGRVAQHNHAFVKMGPQNTYTHVIAEKVGGSVNISVHSGVRSLLLLKTTQSGFENFHRDEFRALGDTNDRLVGTSVDGEWTFTPAAIASRPDYEALNKLVLNTLIDEFAGPADKGVYSVSVQQTLYDMGTGLLAKVPGVEKIELYMPNIHNIPVDLSKFKIENKDHTGKPDIFLPTTDPHGMIKAVIERPRSARL